MPEGPESPTRTGWPSLLERAQSADRDLRHIALIRSYCWVEHALQAMRIAHEREPLSYALRRAHTAGHFTPDLQLSDLESAIRVRHRATHVDTVPGPDQCAHAVNLFLAVWATLRSQYVTLPHAQAIAAALCGMDGIQSVSLYGSLSPQRTRRLSFLPPGDIDLLVMDDGRYSAYIEQDIDYLDHADLTESILTALDMNDYSYLAATACRWLDLSIFNGGSLGFDKAYTAAVTNSQSDRYFFLNISPDLYDYRPRYNDFRPTRIPFFVSLRKLKARVNAILRP